MSDEYYITAPWVGPTSLTKVLSVVVLSSNANIIKKIAEALTEAHAKANEVWNIQILQSFDLEKILQQNDWIGKMAIDFIILAIDTTNMFCIDWTKKTLTQIHPDLRMRRVVLVNASGLPVNNMDVSPNDLLSFCVENRLDLLSGDVFKRDQCLNLANRLLKYFKVSLGVNTGVPSLNV